MASNDQILHVMDKMAQVSLDQAKLLKELKIEMAKATIVINMQGDRIDELERSVNILSAENWPVQ